MYNRIPSISRFDSGPLTYIVRGLTRGSLPPPLGRPEAGASIHKECMMKVGISVTCTVCGFMKKPIGRSGSPAAHYCRYEECVGYKDPPYVGSLWPGETEEEFGYAVGNDGVETRSE